MTQITTKNSSTGASVPATGDLVKGELAVNVADKKLYTKDAGGAIVELGTNPTTIDINAGTIDGTAIGATTPSTGVFTNVTGTLLTAAQPNITSLGTITSLVATTADINGGTIDGTVIGGTTTAAISGTTGTFSSGIEVTGDLKLGDNDKATFGAGDDLQIYHDGSNGIINNAGSGSLIIQDTDGTGDIYIRPKSGQTAIAAYNDNTVEIAHSGNVKLYTTSTGIGVTGTATMDGLKLGDNDKATFGAGDDLQIYHDGTGSIIADTGTGQLFVRGQNLLLQNADGSKAYFSGIGDVASLYHGTSNKLDTTSTGIDVTGTATMDGLTVAGSLGSFAVDTQGVVATFSRPSTSYIRASNVAGSLRFDTGGSVARQFIANNGDISFYEDTGTTAKFFWDASAESLGIGTDSPSYKADILSTNQNALRLNTTDANGCFLAIQTNGTAKGYLGSSHHLVTGTPSEDDITLRAENNLQFTTNGGAEAMRIDSTGNVGIGNSNPAGYGKFLVQGTGNLINANASSGAASFQLYEGGQGRFAIETLNGSAGAKFLLAGTERMRIDSSGNVGIGTDSPISKLNVKGTQGNWRVDPDSVSGEIQVLATTTANDGFRNFRLRSNASIFETGGTEAMRIDSSGNLLVGKTGLGIGVVGTEARAGGQLLVTADADNPLDLNRKTSDGVIALFRKDSATVGSIGTEGGNLTIDGSTATGKSGIEFSGAEWYPRDGGANSNGAISLGDTSNRFKDLYLSGGVYLGGTGSANKLDDYEEGTWTPVASNYDGIMTVNSATYTKIGNLVTVRAKVSFDATADVSGVNLAGLPFTTTGPDKGNGGFVTSSTVSSASRLAAVGSSSIFLLADDGSNVTYATVASTSLQFVFIYETTA